MQCRRCSFNSWFGKILRRRDGLLTPVFLSFPCGSAGKETTCNFGDLGLIPGLGRFLGEAKGYPLQYSGLENSMDSIVHGVAQSQTQLSDFDFTSLHFMVIDSKYTLHCMTVTQIHKEFLPRHLCNCISNRPFHCSIQFSSVAQPCRTL